MVGVSKRDPGHSLNNGVQVVWCPGYQAIVQTGEQVWLKYAKALTTYKIV